MVSVLRTWICMIILSWRSKVFSWSRRNSRPISSRSLAKRLLRFKTSLKEKMEFIAYCSTFLRDWTKGLTLLIKKNPDTMMPLLKTLNPTLDPRTVGWNLVKTLFSSFYVLSCFFLLWEEFTINSIGISGDLFFWPLSFPFLVWKKKCTTRK